jgi:hypothetical protein
MISIASYKIPEITPFLFQKENKTIIKISTYFIKIAKLLENTSILNILTHGAKNCLLEVLNIDVTRNYPSQFCNFTFHYLSIDFLLQNSKRIALESSAI